MSTLKVWDGSAWVTVAGPSGSGSDPVHVGPEAPPGTPVVGDEWFDTDEVSPLVLPINVSEGGTGAQTAAVARTNLGIPSFPLGLADGGTGGSTAATARTNLWTPGIGNSTTTAGPPGAGTWTRGDQWLDSANVMWTCITAGTPGTWTAIATSGQELNYTQITAPVNVTATSAATAQTIIDGGTQTYDGSPVIAEFYMPYGEVVTPSNWGIVHLWDNANDLGQMVQIYGPGSGAFTGGGGFGRRRFTPTPGSHNFRIRAWASAGTFKVDAGIGAGGATYMPTYLRITRA